MSDSEKPIPFQPHEDVGDEGSRYRIPGATKARTGHHFVATDPLDAPDQSPERDSREEQASPPSEHRAEEHLPPPTGRDRPPAGLDQLERHPPGREHPSPGREHPSPGREHPSPGREHPSPGREHPSPGREHPPPGRAHPPTGIFIRSTKGGTIHTIPGDAAASPDEVGLPRLSPPVIDPDPYGIPAKVEDTLTGATTKDVDQPWVIGHPSHGMTSREQRHDGKSHRKRKGGGTGQYGQQGGELD